MRLDSTYPTDGSAVEAMRLKIDNIIRFSRSQLARQKSELSPEDYKKAREAIEAQKRLYQSVLGFKW